LQLFILNEEFLVSASHQLALITSLPLVHTARRYYRLNDKMKSLDLLELIRVKLNLLMKKSIKSYYLEEVKVVTRFP
jgi:hypothetical protein